MKRAVTILLTISLLAAGATAPAAGDENEPKNPRTERERVRREKARAAAELDALEADAEDIEQGLDDLADNVGYQEQVLEDAKAAQVKAGQQVNAAQRKVDAMAARIDELGASVKKAALRAFTSSGSSSNMFSALVSGNPTDALQEDVLYGLVAGDIAGALDELAAAHADLRAAERRAEAAAERADEHRVDVESKIVDLEDAIDQQQRLAVKVDERIDETLAEAASLASLDAKLSKEIEAREAKLAAKIRATVKTATVTPAGEIVVPIIPLPVNGLVKVNGITVDASIGPAISQLVEWAAADGIRLTGGGYRSSSDQIAVRRANCGPSNYDIWQKPSSQCRPPAARPGKSMHEKGLAVDFACNGELISNYQHWCYDWISRHAPRVGLRNRGVEAWHWSTNGN